jgi:hypothetical protein
MALPALRVCEVVSAIAVGIGPNNIAHYRRYASPAVRTFARGVKSLCDPNGILGRVDFD